MVDSIRAVWSRSLTGVVAVLAIAVLAAVPQPGIAIALPVAVLAFAIGVGHSPVRRGVAVLVLTAALFTAEVLAGILSGHEAVREFVFCTMRVGLPWLIGFAWQLRTQLHTQAVEQIVAERQRRHEVVRRRRDRERLALAETLHDDLGHALSLVALNLGKLELDSSLTAGSRQSVASARSQLSAAVEQLGTSVSQLRGGSAPGLPRSDSISDLIEQAQTSGANVTLNGQSEPEALAKFDQDLLYRVVQEGLTNAGKHAPGNPVDIDFTEHADHVDVVVSNRLTDTGAAPSGPGSGRTSANGDVSVSRHVLVGPASSALGTGLATLRNRLDERGGGLDVAATEEVFTLSAGVPLASEEEWTAARAEPAPARRPLGEATDSRPAARTTPPAAVDDGRHDSHADELAELSRAHRRGRMVLVAAAVIAVGALVAVEASSLVEARQAHLPAAGFAQITVGDSRSEAAQVLPDHGLSPQPEAPPGIDCHDYAVTGDLLSDSYGDAYRICFADGRVISTETITAEGP